MVVLVDRVSGYTKRIQHETVLEDWWNTRADSRAVFSSCPAAAGPGIRDLFGQGLGLSHGSCDL